MRYERVFLVYIVGYGGASDMLRFGFPVLEPWDSICGISSTLETFTPYFIHFPILVSRCSGVLYYFLGGG